METVVCLRVKFRHSRRDNDLSFFDILLDLPVKAFQQLCPVRIIAAVQQRHELVPTRTENRTVVKGIADQGTGFFDIRISRFVPEGVVDMF